MGRIIRFSWGFVSIPCSVAAGLLAALSATPLAQLEVWILVDGDFVFTLRYMAALCVLFGVKFVVSPLRGLHKAVAVLAGIFPTVCFSLGLLGMLYITFHNAVLAPMMVGGPEGPFGGDPDLLRSSIDSSMILSTVFYGMVSCLVWGGVSQVIFRRYRNVDWHHADENYCTALVLLIFLGGFGAHRFFVGRHISGVFFILTLGFLGAGVLVDGVLLVLRKFRDAEGNVI